MTTPAQMAVDVVFATFGKDAVLSPQAGGPDIAIRVVTKATHDVLDFGDTRILTDTMLMEVRRSEATPVNGDLIHLDGQDYKVQGPPQILDTDRLVWTLDVRKA